MIANHRSSPYVLFASALLALTACRHGRSNQEFVLTAPPPVVSEATLVKDDGDKADEHKHEHAEATGATAVIGPVTMRAAMSHTLYGKSYSRRPILKVDLSGTATSPRERQPLNLALVFDRSGSMAEEQKFMHAIQAAGMVVENLLDTDVVSLIVFNEEATVLSPAGRAVNKDFLRYRLSQFGPAGYTNLSAGLLEAFAQIDSKSAEGQLKRVIVLTDGLANRGITDPEKLRNLVATAHERGIGVSTLGCGSEFSEKVLSTLAKAGGGRYSYVRSGEMIPGAIAAELNGLLDVVAQNVKLEIRVDSGGAITRVYGRLLENPIPSFAVDLGDIRNGEQSLFLLEIEPSKFRKDSTVNVSATLTLDDPETGSRVHGSVQAKAAYSRGVKPIRESANEDVLAYSNILGAMETAEEAMRGLDIDRFEEARKLFDRHYEAARKHAIETRDQQLLNQAFLLKHFMAELSATAGRASLHSHKDARQQIKKNADYRKYLLEHHRSRPEP